MHYEIRKYHPSDIAELYNICFLTSNNGKDVELLKEYPYLLGNIFVAPYVTYEPELCFVLTKNGKPSGYILGTKNSHEFYLRCESDWFPILRKRYKHVTENENTRITSVIKYLHNGHKPRNNIEKYPAHLHIDILPEVQGKGMGRKLMNKFTGQLKNISVAGVHLEVGKANKNAIEFYKHLGFQVLEECEYSLVMGLKLL